MGAPAARIRAYFKFSAIGANAREYAHRKTKPWCESLDMSSRRSVAILVRAAA